jgi:rhodanese-related sulfurtransferase
MDITPLQLNEAIAAGRSPVLIDVREPEELEISALPGALNIPMNQISSRMGEFERGAEMVIICRTGARSGQVTNYLRSIGFTDVKNLIGGMNRWADDVDPSVQKY